MAFSCVFILCVQTLSCVQLYVSPGAVAHQAPLSIGFSRQECWSGLPFLSPVDLPAPGIEPASPALPGRFFTTSTTWEAHFYLWPIHSSVANSWFNQ